MHSVPRRVGLNSEWKRSRRAACGRRNHVEKTRHFDPRKIRTETMPSTQLHGQGDRWVPLNGMPIMRGTILLSLLLCLWVWTHLRSCREGNVRAKGEGRIDAEMPRSRMSLVHREVNRLQPYEMSHVLNWVLLQVWGALSWCPQVVRLRTLVLNCYSPY